MACPGSDLILVEGLDGAGVPNAERSVEISPFVGVRGDGCLQLKELGVPVVGRTLGSGSRAGARSTYPHHGQGIVGGVVVPPGGSVSGGCICLMISMDNQVAARCVNRQGSSRSRPRLKLSKIFTVALQVVGAVGNISFGSSECVGRRHRKGELVRWTFPHVFQSLVTWFRLPDIDLFVDQLSARLPRFLLRNEHTPDGGPDAFIEDWNEWESVDLFLLRPHQSCFRSSCPLRRFGVGCCWWRLCGGHSTGARLC